MTISLYLVVCLLDCHGCVNPCLLRKNSRACCLQQYNCSVGGCGWPKQYRYRLQSEALSCAIVPPCLQSEVLQCIKPLTQSTRSLLSSKKMVLSEQAMRQWWVCDVLHESASDCWLMTNVKPNLTILDHHRKVATYVCTFGTAFFTILYTPYAMPPHLAGRKHVLTDVQETYHKMIDKYVWGLPPKEAIAEKKACSEDEG